MKTAKFSNLFRSVALFLVAVALIGTVGFAASGWQSITDPDDNSGNVADSNDDADNDKNETPNDNTGEPEIYIPKYTSYLTGLELTEAEYFSRPVCFVTDTTYPCYGLSSASMLVELPTENGQTRLIAYLNATALPGKIGSITPSRGYIDNLINYFGGILVANGNDDSVRYSGFDISASRLDLSEKTGYHYTEYTKYVYTNGDLITAGTVNSGIASYIGQQSAPYSFVDFGADEIGGIQSASSITLPYAQGNETELVYSKATGNYTLYKSQQIKKDLLNDRALEYKNVFVLFADATTFESATVSQTVIDTVSGGNGKYFTNGACIDFTWSVDADGKMHFISYDGNTLTINRGSSYIGFVKSSQMDELVIK